MNPEHRVSTMVVTEDKYWTKIHTLNEKTATKREMRNGGKETKHGGRDFPVAVA